MTVMKRHEAIMLRKYVKTVDPHAFVLIMNTGEIIGRASAARTKGETSWNTLRA